MMPLYSQGLLAGPLPDRPGRQAEISELSWPTACSDENWSRATKQHYGYDNLLALQNTWLDWVRKGSPAIDTPHETPALVAVELGASGRATVPRRTRCDQRRTAPSRRRVRPSAACQRDTGGRSVYESGRECRSNACRPAAAGDDWQPRGGTRSPPAAMAAAADGRVAGRDRVEAPADKLRRPTYQVTRPQPIQRPRQVILEWNRAARRATRRGPPRADCHGHAVAGRRLSVQTRYGSGTNRSTASGDRTPARRSRSSRCGRARRRGLRPACRSPSTPRSRLMADMVMPPAKPITAIDRPTCRPPARARTAWPTRAPCRPATCWPRRPGSLPRCGWD